MKIAIVGKGGSGKSSVSWLLTNYLAETNNQVFAIDADHNMDLLSNFGVNYNSKLPTIHANHEKFRTKVGLQKGEKWIEIYNNTSLPEFTIFPNDEYTNSISIPFTNNIQLCCVGLGDDDITFSGKCAHAHSTPLKYYLPLVKLRENQHVVIDSVAGIDMINFGLYFGCDAVVNVVEMNVNSIRVSKQISDICHKLSIPYFCVINKFDKKSELYSNFETENKTMLLGKIGLDFGVLKYDYSQVNRQTKVELREIISKLNSFNTIENKLENLHKFDEVRTYNNSLS